MKLIRFSYACLTAVLLAASSQAQSVEPKNTVITSDGPAVMISNEKQTETTITFKDHVVAVGTNMKLNCDYLEVVVIRSGEQTATIGKLDKFRSMVATGNVLFILGDREAACGRAEILPGDGKVILSENPVVVDHDQNTRFAGETIRLFSGTHRVEVDKPILTAPPVKDLGVDKEIKPTTPPAATPAAPAPAAVAAPKQS